MQNSVNLAISPRQWDLMSIPPPGSNYKETNRMKKWQFRKDNRDKEFVSNGACLTSFSLPASARLISGFHQDPWAMSCQVVKTVWCECLRRFTYEHCPTRSTLITTKLSWISWQWAQLWCCSYQKTVPCFNRRLCVFGNRAILMVCPAENAVLTC